MSVNDEMTCVNSSCRYDFDCDCALPTNTPVPTGQLQPTVTPNACSDEVCSWCAPEGQCEASGGTWQTQCNNYCAGSDRCCYVGGGGGGHGETHCDLDGVSWNIGEMPSTSSAGEEIALKGRIVVPAYFALKDVFKVCVYEVGRTQSLVCNQNRDDLIYLPDNPGQKDMGGVVEFELSWTPTETGQISLYPEFTANYYNPGSEADLNPVWTCGKQNIIYNIDITEVLTPTTNPNCTAERVCDINVWLNEFSSGSDWGSVEKTDWRADVNCDKRVDLIDYELIRGSRGFCAAQS